MKSKTDRPGCRTPSLVSLGLMARQLAHAVALRLLDGANVSSEALNL